MVCDVEEWLSSSNAMPIKEYVLQWLQLYLCPYISCNSHTDVSDSFPICTSQWYDVVVWLCSNAKFNKKNFFCSNYRCTYVRTFRVTTIQMYLTVSLYATSQWCDVVVWLCSNAKFNKKNMFCSSYRCTYARTFRVTAIQMYLTVSLYTTSQWCDSFPMCHHLASQLYEM